MKWIRAALLSLCAFSIVFAQVPSSDAPDLIVPIVGSTGGAFGANFQTQVQLTNRSDQPMRGRLVFRRAEARANGNEPSLAYDLAPHQTRMIADLVTAMSTGGIGSLDLFVDSGDAPTILVRVYDERESGSASVNVPAVDPESSLRAGEQTSFVVPADLENFRFNVGIRTLSDGASIEIVVRGANGATKTRVGPFDYPPQFLEQRRADVFARARLEPGDALTVRVLEGRAILYTTAVDNRNSDSTIQIGLTAESE